MDDDGGGDDQARKGQAIRDLFHGRPSRAQGRRCDVGAAEVVNNAPNSHINGSHSSLADN